MMSAGDVTKEVLPVRESSGEEEEIGKDGKDGKDALSSDDHGKADRAQKDAPPETDEFGLPVNRKAPRHYEYDENEDGANEKGANDEEVACNKSVKGEAASNAGVKEAVNGEVAGKEKTADTETRPAQNAQATVGAVEPPSPQQFKHKTQASTGSVPSEWSHQQLAPKPVVDDDSDDNKEDEWQEMPAFATHRMYDDWGKVVAKEYGEVANDDFAYGKLGGAGKGYTRVQDDDAQSATSMDDNTAYLFKNQYATNTLADEDEETRDAVSQMQATKELLTEGQRIAYVGIVRLSIGKMLDELDKLEKTKGAKKQLEFAVEAMKMWGQKVMVRLYKHMDIDQQEQIMVEQLSEHGVLPSDLTPTLMQNAQVKNPNKDETSTDGRPSISSPLSSPRTPGTPARSSRPSSPPLSPTTPDERAPPAYGEHTADELKIEDISQFEDAKDIQLDLRWTVLCDLFLLLIADSIYDSRSRTLLEHVGGALSVDWQEVCRFEKRITDALEMQQQADKEDWNEEEHLQTRAKNSRKKRLMVMGLCTVGGGLVIGLSAGLLAPVIGAGLAAGFTTIGIAGTSTFLGGTGAAALIGTGATLAGSFIGVRASDRRTGAVKTFEYRPLFNNKRANLIVTVSGWMTGNIDDVRLPFSTVNPIMGDIYSVNWEPDMLRSMGQTIAILATEALTSTVQQVLGGTILTALMAGLALPVMLAKLSYLIDNPWNVSIARADATGLILADSLIDRNLGIRPITLVGFSLGSRVIFSCLRELAKRGAYGIVQNVFLFGSPMVAKKDEYLRARSVVSGRFVNGYASNDWILGYLFRATSGGIMRVSGLAAVDIPGIENRNVTELVPGHMAYRGKMPILLKEVGWLVEGDEFSEIEDPDPENHEKRQRELIDEIEAARRDLAAKEEAAKAAAGADGKKKKTFMSLFSRKNAAPKKQAWEMYDERSQKQKFLEGDDPDVDKDDAPAAAAATANIMFDVDAIRKEALQLAVQGTDIDDLKRHLSVREIQSTMPMLKIVPVSSPQPDPVLEPPSKSHQSTPERRPSPRYSLHRRRSNDSASLSLSLEPAATTFSPDRASPSPSSSAATTPATSARPPMRSAATTPAPAGSGRRDLSGERGGGGGGGGRWAGEVGGEEGEVRMTFE